MNAKKWIKIWFCIIIVIPLVGIFNYKIDSLGLVTQNGYLDKAAKSLADGKILSGLNNFDERIFRKKIIQNIKYEINWIAVGSSRTMQLRKNMFLREREREIGFQNYAVSDASLEDHIVLIQAHYDKFKKYPKNIILGIDPWVFNKNNQFKKFVSLKDEYIHFMKILDNNYQATSIQNSNYKKIFSIQYLKKNIKFIRKNLHNGLRGFDIETSTNVDKLLRNPDGSILYEYKSRFPNFEDVKKQAIEYTKGGVYGIENFEKIGNKTIFEKFITYLQSKNINIYFYLAPYNPYTYDILIADKKYKIINDIELYLIHVATKFNIKLIGSYNPHKYGFTNKDFFDGMHSLDTVYNKLFKNLVAL